MVRCYKVQTSSAKHFAFNTIEVEEFTVHSIDTTEALGKEFSDPGEALEAALARTQEVNDEITLLKQSNGKLQSRITDLESKLQKSTEDLINLQEKLRRAEANSQTLRMPRNQEDLYQIFVACQLVSKEFARSTSKKTLTITGFTESGIGCQAAWERLNSHECSNILRSKS